MIPREAYIYPTGYDQVASEIDTHPTGEKYSLDIKRGVRDGYFKSSPSEDGQYTTITVIPNDGIFTPITGATFPMKGMATPESVYACNLVKALFIEPIKIISRWYLVPFLFLINKQKTIDAFNRISMKAISSHLLVDTALSRFTVEFRGVIYRFFSSIGFTDKSSYEFALIFTHIIEYDNVYRYRLEDTFSETTKDRLLKRPIKEVLRLLSIMKSREVRPDGKGDAIHKKFSSIAYILVIALCIPKMRRAFRDAIRDVDFNKLCLDETDTYWVCLRNDYLWMGLSDDERAKYVEERGWKHPIPMVE